MGAVGATVAHASDTVTPSAPHPVTAPLIRLWCRSEVAPIVSAIPQQDPPHRTAGAVDPGQQLGPPCAATAAVMAHAVDRRFRNNMSPVAIVRFFPESRLRPPDSLMPYRNEGMSEGRSSRSQPVGEHAHGSGCGHN
jgi:hypothetical protein